MYLADVHSIVIRSIADLFDNINGRNRAYLAAIITSRGIVGAVNMMERYTFDPRKQTSVEITVTTAAGMSSPPVRAGECRLCFTLEQLSSLIFMRADLAAQFRQLVEDFKVTSPHPTGVLFAGGALALTY